MKRHTVRFLCAVLSTTMVCAVPAAVPQAARAQETENNEHAQTSASEAPALPGLTWDHALELSYADQVFRELLRRRL